MSNRHRSRAETASSLHLSDYLRVIYKRRWTAVLGVLLVFMTGAFKSLRTTPIYEAAAQIQIEEGSRGSSTISGVVESQQSSYYQDDFYQTQYRILQSRALALRVVEQLGLLRPVDVAAAPDPSWSDKAFAWIAESIGVAKPIAPPPADETTAQAESIGAFLGGLHIEPVRNTRLVEIRYRSPDPAMAARAANAVAEQYKKQNTQSRFLASQETNTWLDGQLEEQRKLVEESDLKLQQYKEANGVVAVDDRQNVLVQQLGDLTAEVTRARTERVQREALYNQLLALQSNGADPQSYPALAGNDVVQKLKIELNGLQRQRAELRLQFLEQAPEVKRQDERIRETQAQLAAEITRAVDALKTDYLAAKAKEDSLQQTLDARRQESIGAGRKGMIYAALEREAAGNRQLYENLLQMAKETGVTTQYKGSSISIIDSAVVPRTPVLPRTRRDLTMALLGGCLLALGLVFGFEYMDSRLKTPDEIKTHLGLPFLGIVPAVNGKQTDALLIDGAVPQAFAEAIKAVRTSVIFSSADEGSRTIVVTSTAPAEGKTSVASNLACALAQTEQKTLLIDGDMRRPRLHDIFGRPQEPGLSNVLVGTARLRDAIRTTNVGYLQVMPAGHLPPNPAELLGSNRYIELIAQLQQDYDWIVIDAPPVMAVTDAAVISHTATGVMFVVGAEMTPRRNAIEAVDQLTAARAKFVGVVLNRVNIEKHSYYYSPYYRKDYSRAYERAAP
jgi:capsular exopolysaccharide synthesis family protein